MLMYNYNDQCTYLDVQRESYFTHTEEIKVKPPSLQEA